MLCFKGFAAIDLLVRSYTTNPILMALLFFAILGVAADLLGIPFSLNKIFVIEEKFGFNKTTPKTFALDLIKGLVLGMALGAPVFAGLIWFFEHAGPLAWFYSWICFTCLQLTLLFLAPILILPLFNKFVPLPEGELQNAVHAYSHANRFKLSGVFTMDSSKRSTKGNAFFTGFGRFRRLVLFDTLVARQTVDELVAIFAHEVGHYKLHHIQRFTAFSIGSSALLFFILSLFIRDAGLFSAFGMENVSVYASLIFISFLYSPILRALSLVSNWLSRRAEFEADEFSAQTFGKPEVLISALKKLSIDNLSHLTPHPFKVVLEYTHPPIMERIRALRGRG